MEYWKVLILRYN